MIIAREQTDKSMEQNRWLRNKSYKYVMYGGENITSQERRGTLTP